MDRITLKNVMMDYQNEVSNYEVMPRDFGFEDFSNYIFVGIRRSGKSYMLYQRIQQLLKKGTRWDEMIYLNFEDDRLLDMTLADLNLVLELHLEMYGKKPILFLDEIQNVEGWERFARRLADTKHRVYITGSNAKMLSQEIQSTLGGRYISIQVYPYSFQEYLAANELELNERLLNSTAGRAEMFDKFNAYFNYGGFPEAARLSVKRDYLISVYQKIFLGDIAIRYSISNIFALRVMFKKLAESIKQPLSYTRVTNMVSSAGVKISKNTVINYIEYAKEAWLINTIQNIAGKLADKEMNPKYYFTDNGILNLFLLDANTSLLENIVAIHLLRTYGREDAVFFYNKGVEVDFYIPEAALAIQVCYQLNGGDDTFERETNALIKLSKVLECRQLMIITYDSEEIITIGNKTIEVIPAWKFLLQSSHKNLAAFF
ncbi:MAG: ATP-binding protein [Mangrovibacterium sp.]